MIDTAYFLGLTLVFIRLATFFLVAKVFYPSGTPNILKGVLGIILSFFVISGIDTQSLLEISNNYMLITSIVSEFMCGLVLGFIVGLIFEIAKMAGAFMDTQIGLSMLNMMDPISKTNVTLLSNVSYYMSVVIFFIIDGHHVLIKCLVASFDVIPVGGPIIFQNSFYLILDSFSKYFIIGVRIALPIVLIVLLTDICMALISRTVPAINVMILGMPVRMTVGLLVFVLALPLFIKMMTYAFGTIPDMLSDLLKSLSSVPLILIFAADDKTEDATPKKKSEARKKGQIAKSKDVGIAITMIAITLVILTVSATIIGSLKEYMQVSLQSGILRTLDKSTMGAINITVISKIVFNVLPFVVPIMIAGVAASIAQSGFMLTGEPLKPAFSKLNPIKGFKNIFSMKSLADLIKNLIVVSIVAYIGYKYVDNNYEVILQMSNIYLPSLGIEVLNIILGIFMQITILLVIIGAIDYIVQFKLHNKDLKMSKQEVKEEYKQMEGDPQVKGKIKQKQKEMASKRMMSSVADATVIITNPTHLAVAIKYDDGVNSSPKVVAKGAELIALKIKEIAKENDIPIMENKPLARLIYEQVEIDDEIPQEMFQAVAEILAMVYKLKKK
ncbi:fused FliR family export protein/FlhB family type III secretion system protein [Clostridium vincentii]|uniref:Flagellar biosynthetic protein FlhB n=1 Tax=Clostridium vincentii TaxID=52704 RepID=A0A2T0BJE2_9CLOT|nr:fused FliR family export protein/FlhB family type III secretion system protein [Clostridium vincentii]PRR83967.1 Flagellar biosynthetic protein FlhB [Clostridium vincentii]